MQIVDTAERAIARALSDPNSEYAKAVMLAQSEASEKPEPSADERVQELEQQLVAAQDELDRATDAARRGDAESVRATNLSRLAERIAALNSELSVAREAAATAALERRSREREEQERTFAEAVEQARIHRDEFRTAYQHAIVALGQFCQCAGRATDARNKLVLGLPFADPALDAELRSITDLSALEVLDQLRAEGFGPVLSFGWNFNFQISPLAKKEQ
jgi:hypothetical protein